MRKIIFVTALLALVGPASSIAQTTFTVNSDDDVDDGTCNAIHCSLREAIGTANALAGTDTIAFNITGGAEDHTIVPTGALPTISDSVFIDGWTQPNFNGDPLIELDGRNAGAVDGLTITAGGSTVRGLAIFNFANGVVLNTTGGNAVIGNVIGAESKASRCGFGNVSSGVLATSSGNTVGGSTLAEGNQVVCNGGDGIYILNADDNVIQGNFIGIDEVEDPASETGTDLGNGRDGIRIRGSGNTVGGGFVERNTIVFNAAAGVMITGASSSSNRLVGNTIAANGGDGVALPDAGNGNAIEGSAIFENGALGIDLGADGVTLNDVGDNDNGPNGLQNYPEISSVKIGSAVFIEGLLQSSPNTRFDIEFFSNSSCDASNHGEGEAFLARDSKTTDDSGDADISVTIGNVDPGDYVTATATNPDGSTSEFSACAQAISFEVSVRPDSNTVSRGGSARYAIDVEPVGGPYNYPVALRCISQPPFSSCTFTQDTVVPGANGVTSFLTVATNVSGISSVVGAWPGALAMGLPALGLGLFLLSDGRRRRRYGLPLLVALMVGGAALQAGCDDGNVNGPSGGGTPPGRYVLQIRARSEPITVIETAIMIVTP